MSKGRLTDESSSWVLVMRLSLRGVPAASSNVRILDSGDGWTLVGGAWKSVLVDTRELRSSQLDNEPLR